MKNVDVVFNKYLSFEEQKSKICNKAYFILYLINQCTKKYLTLDCQQIL